MAFYKKGFQGNQRVRPAGIPIEWTPEKLADYAKCASDPLHFISTHVLIKNIDCEDLVPFLPRSYQEEMLDKMLSDRFVIVKLPRQAGKTTIVAAVLLWHILFNTNFAVLVAAHNGAKARDVLNSIKTMYENLPEHIQHGCTEWNKGTIILETGSRVRAAATSGSSGRGDTYNCVYIDEAAFLQPHIAQEFFESVIPTISSGKTSKIFITSTPKGLNHFYRMFMAAKAGTSGYTYVEIKWNDVPGRDEKFKAEIIAQFGERYFAQEYAAEFQGSSLTLIDGNTLTRLVVEKPIIDQFHYRIYEHPVPSHQYAATVDVAEGVEGDSSAISVVDITELPYKVVAVYKNNIIAPLAFPAVIYDFATKYNKAMVLVESNFGQQIADILWTDMEYEFVIMTARSAKKGEHVSGGFAASARPGLQMTRQSKHIGCSNLKALVEQDQLIVRDSWIIDELCRFTAKGKSYEAVEGHDDLTMTLVMFSWLVDQGYVKDSTNQDIRRKIAEMNAKAIDDDMMAFGGISTGHDGEDVVNISFAHESPDGRDSAMHRLGDFFEDY